MSKPFTSKCSKNNLNRKLALLTFYSESMWPYCENILQKKSLLFSLSVHLGSTWFDLFVCLCGFNDNQLYYWFTEGTVLVESVWELLKSTDDDICAWFCCRWWAICWFYHLRIVGCDTVALFVNNDTADMSSSRVGAVLLMCWPFLSANQPSIYVSLFMLKLKLKTLLEYYYWLNSINAFKLGMSLLYVRTVADWKFLR